jgi:uncharacterized protein (TIGR04255 family)
MTRLDLRAEHDNQRRHPTRCPECGSQIAAAAIVCPVCGNAEGPETATAPAPTAADGQHRAASVLTLAQVDIESAAPLTEGHTVLALHSSLGGADGPYPVISKQQPAPGGQAGAGMPATPGWTFASREDRWRVILAGQAFALQTTTGDATDPRFVERLSAVIRAVAHHASPAMEGRVGMRQVHDLRSADPGPPTNWRSRLTPALLGMAVDERFGSAVLASEQTITIDGGDDYGCTIRHGFARRSVGEPVASYLLDLDAYRTGLRRFDPQGTEQALTRCMTLLSQLCSQLVKS